MKVCKDPFVYFVISCLVAPPLWLKFGVAQTLDYFYDPYMWAFIALTFGAAYYTHGGCKYLFAGCCGADKKCTEGKPAAAVATRNPDCVSLSSFETFRARWYLLNGTIIHGYLDGAVGGFAVNKTMAAQYATLDKRYADKGPYGTTLHAISVLELVLYAPLCVALYYAFHRGKAYRSALEVLVCAFQLFGTLIYIGQEHFAHYPSLMVSCVSSASVNCMFYFWFAVVLGVALWIIVPSWFIVVAVAESRTVAAARGASLSRSASPAGIVPAARKRTARMN